MRKQKQPIIVFEAVHSVFYQAFLAHSMCFIKSRNSRATPLEFLWLPLTSGNIGGDFIMFLSIVSSSVCIIAWYMYLLWIVYSQILDPLAVDTCTPRVPIFKLDKTLLFVF